MCAVQVFSDWLTYLAIRMAVSSNSYCCNLWTLLTVLLLVRRYLSNVMYQA